MSASSRVFRPDFIVCSSSQSIASRIVRGEVQRVALCRIAGAGDLIDDLPARKILRQHDRGLQRDSWNAGNEREQSARHAEIIPPFGLLCAVRGSQTRTAGPSRPAVRFYRLSVIRRSTAERSLLLVLVRVDNVDEPEHVIVQGMSAVHADNQKAAGLLKPNL